MPSHFIEIALWNGCPPVNLLHIFRIPFLKNTSGRLLLNFHPHNSWANFIIYLNGEICCRSHLKEKIILLEILCEISSKFLEVPRFTVSNLDIG